MPVAVRSVARAVLLTSGRPVLVRASALFATLGIAGAILFAGQGMRAADLVRLFHGSLGVRALLSVGWTVMALPAVARAFDAPGTRTLRALRVTEVPVVLSLLAVVALVESPWAVLFARGEGPLAAAAATALAASLHVALATLRAPGALRPQSRSRRSFALACAPLVLVAWDPARALVLPVAAFVAFVSVRDAWRYGADTTHAATRWTRPMPALAALATAYVLRLLRAERPRLSLGALGATLGCGLLSFSLRNDPTARPLQRGLMFMALPTALAAAVLVAPLREVERKLRPWLGSLRVRASSALLAFGLALAMPSSAFAAASGAVAGAAGGASVLALGGGLALASLISSGSIAAWSRWHDKTRARSPVVFVVGVVAIAAATLGAAAAW